MPALTEQEERDTPEVVIALAAYPNLDIVTLLVPENCAEVVGRSGERYHAWLDDNNALHLDPIE